VLKLCLQVRCLTLWQRQLQASA